jgi:hypothetical protein
MSKRQKLTLVVHGESGVGKSYLADTSPAPRLILDVEGGVDFTPSRKLPWDPVKSIPEVDGTWDSLVVHITNENLASVLTNVDAWLNTREHPLRSLVIDSMSELGKRKENLIAGAAQMTMQSYGELYRWLDMVVRRFRDMTNHPSHPLDVVVFVCGTREKGMEKGVVRPSISGRMAEEIGYAVDVMGYLSVSISEANELRRTLTVAPLQGVAAKDRTGKLGVYIEDPSIPGMLEMVYGEEKK